MRDVLVVVIAYALGCVQTGYYLVLVLTGQDLRRLGTGSTGARNSGRVLGPMGFAFTLLGDTGKGALAMAAALWLEASPGATASALVAVTVGHIWPVQLRFSGGRGVAVALGALAVFQPLLLGVLVLVTVLAWAITRHFQGSGLVGFVAIPFAAWFFHVPAEALVGVTGLSLLVLFAHRSHITRWLKFAPRAENTPAVKPGD
jgi:acyl phosphate:glycerol-3-phosphate acyltransferase